MQNGHVNERTYFKEIFGLKSVFLPDIMQSCIMQLIIKTSQRKEENDLNQPALLLCLFEMLKTVVVSGGKEDDIAIELKNEMVKRLSYRYEIKQISQIKETVHKLANPATLNQFLAHLTCTANVSTVNWPVVEGAVKVHTSMVDTGAVDLR